MLRFPPYSYIISARPIEHVDGVKSVLLRPGQILYYTSDQEYNSVGNASGVQAFILGICIDCGTDAETTNQILSIIVRKRNNHAALYDYIDALAGRFIVGIYSEPNDHLVVISDATGALKVNYAETGGYASSNIFLLSAVLDQNSTPVYRPEYEGECRHLWKFGSLGDLSPIRNIRILIPNNALDFSSATTFRIFPRKGITRMKVEEVSEYIRKCSHKQYHLLRRNYTLFQSLTAGIDSRLTLSLSRNFKNDITYFTYCFKPDSERMSTEVKDMVFSSILANKLGINHYQLYATFKFDGYNRLPINNLLTITPEELARYQEFKNEFIWYIHIPQTSVAYRKMVLAADGQKPPLHIRSNIYEIGRCFWQPHSETRNLLDSRDVLSNSRVDWHKNDMSRSIFEEYFQRTRLRKSDIYDYDILDLFYWEHRCGTWVSEIIQASDYAFNTHSLLNSRRMLECLLSLSPQERRDYSAFHAMIELGLPELRGVPVNPVIQVKN